MKTNLHALAAQNHSGAEVDERQIEATLAVAYEQHTANLIAARESEWTTGAQVLALTEQIAERLGLK